MSKETFMEVERAEAVVGKDIWVLMRKTFEEWIDQDRFGGRWRDERKHIQETDSVREMVGNVLMFEAQRGLWRGDCRAKCTLDMSLNELIGCEIRMDNGARREVGVLFQKGLCALKLRGLVSEATSFNGTQGKTAEGYWEELAKSAGCQNMQDVQRRLEVGVNAVVLSETLVEVLKEKVGARALWSFFRQDPGESGYVSWWPGAYSHAGESLRESEVKTARGVVRMRVSRYEDTSDAGIRAYEWAAELRVGEAERVPSAAANGMVYVLPRSNGDLMCSASDLRWAADAVADTDVAQVMAFLKQHKDAEERMKQGDLCFLWLWERKSGSEKGCGAEVLEAALGDLKRRFRGVKTLIVDITPGQFAERSMPQDPPAVQVARMEAIDRIREHLEAMRPARVLKGEMRLTLTLTKEMSPEETMLALGMADLAERR